MFPSVSCTDVKISKSGERVNLLEDPIYSKVIKKDTSSLAKAIGGDVQSKVEDHISNDLDADKATRHLGHRKTRLPVQNIFIYEVQSPIEIEFSKASMKAKASCFDQTDEDAVLRALEMLNDLVPLKKKENIYDMYKTNPKLQQFLRINNVQKEKGSRTEEFAINQKLALFYFSNIFTQIVKLPLMDKIYDNAWERPLIYRLTSVRRHLQNALTNAIKFKTQHTINLNNGQLACQKFIQIQRLLQASTTFLNQLSTCTGNNFAEVPAKTLSCKFDFTFPELIIAKTIEFETLQSIMKETSLLEQTLKHRSSSWKVDTTTVVNRENEGRKSMHKQPKNMKETMQTKSSNGMKKSLASKAKNNKKERREEDTKISNIEEATKISNKAIMPIIAGRFNPADAKKGLYKSGNIVHNDATYFILTKQKAQMDEASWRPIPDFQQRRALKQDYKENDIVTFGDQVYTLSDINDQDKFDGWSPIKRMHNVDSNIIKHTLIPNIYGIFDPVRAKSNKYELKDIVYAMEDEAYYVLIDPKRQNEDNAWVRINHIDDKLAAASGYNANDLVENDGQVFLLFSPFKQTDPESWMVLPRHDNNIQMEIKKATAEKRKKEKIFESTVKNELAFEEREKKKLKILNEKMNMEIKKSMHRSNNNAVKTNTGLPPQYPKDKCIYHSSQTSLKKLVCGAPTKVNMKNGINVFEIPLEDAYLDPNVMNSKNFAYGITDRCGHLQKYLTVSIRDPVYLGSIDGRYAYTLPKLVGELDCLNHDCQVHTCNQLTGMASVISANLYVYRKVRMKETNGTATNNMPNMARKNVFVAEYEINGKGSTFSVDFVRHPINRVTKKFAPSSKQDYSFLEVEQNKIEIQNICNKLKKLLTQHPDASEDDVSLYLHEEYDMVESEMLEIRKQCNEKEMRMKVSTTEELHKQKKKKLQVSHENGNREDTFQRRHRHEWLSRAHEC